VHGLTVVRSRPCCRANAHAACSESAFEIAYVFRELRGVLGQAAAGGEPVDGARRHVHEPPDAGVGRGAEDVPRRVDVGPPVVLPALIAEREEGGVRGGDGGSSSVR
jgi:hypothetical protein